MPFKRRVDESATRMRNVLLIDMLASDTIRNAAAHDDGILYVPPTACIDSYPANIAYTSCRSSLMTGVCTIT